MQNSMKYILPPFLSTASLHEERFHESGVMLVVFKLKEDTFFFGQVNAARKHYSPVLVLIDKAEQTMEYTSNVKLERQLMTVPESLVFPMTEVLFEGLSY